MIGSVLAARRSIGSVIGDYNNLTIQHFYSNQEIFKWPQA